MRITMQYDGLTFVSAETKEITVVEAKAQFYDLIENMTKLEMEMPDGSFIVFGKAVIEKAVFTFSE